MPKIKSPSPATETPATDTPAVDISPLIAALAPILTDVSKAEDKISGGIVEIAVECRDFRAKNKDVERSQIRLGIATAVAESKGLVLATILTKPAEAPTNATKDKLALIARQNSAYTLVSTLLSIAWPKEEKQDAAVAKLLKDGEDRFVVLKKAAAKQQKPGGRDPDTNKITASNFAEKLMAFLSRAQSDMAVPMDEILGQAEDAVQTFIATLNEAPVPAAATA